MSDLLTSVLRDEEMIGKEKVPVKIDDSISHYGRLGMKWYQHIYGEYQGAAKYAEKGAAKIDKLQDRGRISEATRLRKRVDKVLKVAEKEQSLTDARKAKIAQAINEHSSDKEVRKAAEKIQQFEETSKASDEIIENLKRDRISDLARGVGDWTKASDEDLAAATNRLYLEKQYKDIRDDVSGVKVWKEAGQTALKSVANSAGNIVSNAINTYNDISKKRVDAEISESKDARTWAREDKVYARDRKDKLADQARDDKNAELKAQRDIEKEETKNRDKYLEAVTKSEKQKREFAKEDASDTAIRDVLDGKKDASSLSPSQAKNLKDWTEQTEGKDKTVRDVLDERAKSRQAVIDKAASDIAAEKAEREAQAEFNVKFASAGEKAMEEARRKRERDSAESYRKMTEREESAKRAQQKREKETANDLAKKQAADAERERKLTEIRERNAKAQAAATKESGTKWMAEQYETKRRNDAFAAEAKRQATALREEADKARLRELFTFDVATGKANGSSRTETPNVKLQRQLMEFSTRAAQSKAVAESAESGSGLIKKLMSGNSAKVSSYSSRNSQIKNYIKNGGTWAEAEEKYNVSSSTISDIMGHAGISVFKRLTKEDYLAHYAELKWSK